MSPIRYARQGLKLVRVPAPAPPEPPPEPCPPGGLPFAGDALAIADAADDYATRLHRWAAGIRRDAARYKPLRDAEPRSDASKEDVRRARGVAGLTQKELARRLDFGRQHISDMERGRRTVSWSVGEWAKKVLREGGGPEPPA